MLQETAGHPQHPTRVLVIDDSKTIRRSAETLLAREGYEVITATDGFDALSKIADNRPASARWLPDLCADQEQPGLPRHAGGNAVQQGRIVRPRARPHRRF
jgi:CheY-like chemotaxis protein